MLRSLRSPHQGTDTAKFEIAAIDVLDERRMGSHFQRVLEEMVIDAETRVQELPLLSAAENQQSNHREIAPDSTARVR